jgi:hypothetical protein
MKQHKRTTISISGTIVPTDPIQTPINFNLIVSRRRAAMSIGLVDKYYKEHIEDLIEKYTVAEYESYLNSINVLSGKIV